MKFISEGAAGAVVAPPARYMSNARKRRLWMAAEGLCEDCKQPVPMFGKGVVYDHRIDLWTSRDDSDANLRPICKACDQIKTPRDQKQIAKTKRLIRQADPETRKRSKRPIQNRGFQKGVKIKLRGRGFPKRQTV